MRIILLGAPGSGKGTQARKLVETYKVPQISTGDILRAAVQEGSEAGKRAEQIMKEGGLVPDDLVIELVSQRVLKADTRRGFILDGFPRNIPQAQELDTRLGWVSRPIQIAINFEVDEAMLLKRLTGRRTCESCGAIYNVHFNPPKARDKCDECGGALEQRDDDNEETVAARLKVYHEETELLVQYYRAQHKLRTLNATGDTGDIFARLCEMIDTEIRPLESKVISVHGSGDGGATHTQIVGGKIVREVAGSDVRTTKVQPRQPAENGESRDNEPKSEPARRKTAKRPAARAGSSGKKEVGAESASKAARKSAKTSRASAQDAGTATKTAAKKASKKAAVKKTAAKKSTAKKAAAKKSASKKTAAKKSAVKKKAAKKKVVKKQAVRKKVARKKLAAKPATKKKAAAAKKAVTRKTGAAKKAARKAQSKKKAVAAKKTAVKKTAARKTSKKKAAAKKTSRKKTARR